MGNVFQFNDDVGRRSAYFTASVLSRQHFTIMDPAAGVAANLRLPNWYRADRLLP